MALTILHQLAPRTRPARVLAWTAVFWAISALFHAGVYAVDGGAWAGPASWRKPIVFSLSFAMTLWAVGWVLDRMPHPRPRLAGVLAWAFAVSSTIETGLIAMQTWRGRASHFNVAAPGDAAVFAIMGMTVGVLSLVLVVLLLWVLREPPLDRATRWAVTGGLFAIATGLGIGQWLIELGNDWVAATGTVPEAVMNGDAVGKFPHAIAFHGIQAFAVLLAVATVRRFGPDRRLRIMRTAVVGYLGVLTWATVTTVVGTAPLQARGWTVGLGVASGVALVVAGIDTLWPGRRVRETAATA